MDAVSELSGENRRVIGHPPRLRVLFVYSGNNSKTLDPVIAVQQQALASAGVEVELFPVMGRGPTGYLRAANNLRAFLRVNSFDVIHAHYGLCGIAAAYATFCRRLVVSFMGSDIVGAVGFDGRPTIAGAVVSLVSKALARFAYPACIAKSHTVGGLLWKGTGAVVIPNGVDLQAFRPGPQAEARSRAGLPTSSRIALFAANPERPEKNYALAVEAVRQLSEINVKLVAVNQVAHCEMVNWYNAADVLLLTSWHEGSPNVVKEAMACNCPVVATDVGDVRALVGATSGCYVTSFDAADIATKLRLVLTSRARSSARDSMYAYDNRNTAARMIEVYDNVVAFPTKDR